MSYYLTAKETNQRTVSNPTDIYLGQLSFYEISADVGNDVFLTKDGQLKLIFWPNNCISIHPFDDDDPSTWTEWVRELIPKMKAFAESITVEQSNESIHISRFERLIID